MHNKLFYLIFLFLIIFSFSVLATNYTSTNCWDYDGDQDGCEVNDLCTWDSYGAWCYEKSCWNFLNSTDCIAAANLSCNWKTNVEGGWCEEQGCWLYANQTACNNNPGCSWDSTYSYCSSRGCWDYSTLSDCETQSDLGISCNWKDGYCEENGSCWNFRDDQTGCEASGRCFFENMSYEQDDGETYSYSGCYKTSCWDFSNTSDDCSAAASALNLPCSWHADSGWCESVGCWNYDFTNESHCEVNSSRDYNLSCTWDDANYCYEDWSCSKYYSERDCTDTYYCVWDGSTCSPPSSGTIEGNYQNPDCWIFSSNWTTCLNVSGCSFTNTTNTCGGTTADYGISCNNISGKDLCNSISVLSTCCVWENSICNATFGGKCYDNIKDMPTDSGNEIKKCEDATSKSICDQLADDPWYMPCKWDNMTTSTQTDDKCMFNNDNFDTELGEIGGEKLCDMAGGKYVCDCYTNYDGNSESECACIIETGTGTSDCDFNCMACEYKDDGASWGSTAAAADACNNSQVTCEWTTDSNAINGYGWCTYPTSVQYGYGDCDTDCYNCYKNATCTTSLKNCSWKVPTTSGWCEDTTSANCWNQNNETGCEAITGCNWHSNYSYCEQLGCWSYYDESSCTGQTSPNGYDCIWESEWNYCSEQGCWSYDVDNCENATNNDSCQWEGSWCSERDCWNYWDETSCISTDDDLSCTWQGSSEASGWCEDTSMYQAKLCSNSDNLSCQNCMGQTDCENAGCQWNSTFVSNTVGTPLDICILTGNTPEICSNPGDEDQDGYSDCEDPDCSTDPMCGYGFGGDYSGGAYTGFNNSISCATYDFTNETICSNCNGTCASDSCYFHAVSGATNFSALTPNWSGGVAYNDGYLCDPKSEQTMKFGGGMGMMQGAPTEIGSDETGENKVEVQFEFLDIARVGVHDMMDNFEIGISLKNMTDFAGCHKFYQKSLNKTGKYYRYLDTDGNSSGGCKAKDYTGGQLIGFDYMFYYIKNETDETKGSYKCQSSKWQKNTATISAMEEGCIFTDPFATTSSFIGTQILIIQKKDIGNPTNNLRIFISTANITSNESLPLDSAGPFYYTPGSYDFMFEDCMKSGVDMDGDGFTSEQDPDCAMMKTYGYVIKEGGPECGDGVDNDGNGDTDCNDNNCKYNSLYCTTYTFTSPDPNDNTAPSMTWFETSSFPDGAFIMYDTDEPTNGTLIFFGTDSTCQTVNYTINDSGIAETFMEEYRTWHDGPIDNFNYNPQKLNYDLSTDTAYYYKTKVCDPSGNCAISACSNFTTKASYSKKNCPTCEAKFKFDFSAATGVAATDLEGYMRLEGDFTGNDGVFETTMEDNCGCSSATYINYTNLQNFSLKYQNPNSTKEWGLTLKDSTAKKGTLSDELSNLTSTDFIVEDTYSTTTASTVTFVGIEEEKWEKIKTEVSIDYVDINLPGNQGELWHCDDNLENCKDVTSDDGSENLGYNSTGDLTTWRISASLFEKVGM